jgi:hypothetical protein
MTTSSVNTQRSRPGRLLVLLGLGVAIVAVAAYIAQIAAHRLTAPWYLPITATIGLGLVILSLLQARSVWRWLVLLLVVLIAGATWTFLLGTRLPPYTGPVAVGKPFPAFQTVRADGTPFTERDLQGDKNSVMVFFRGRW